MKGEKKKAAQTADDKISKSVGYGTKKNMIVRDLGMHIAAFDSTGVHSGKAVVAKDERGEYVTTEYFVGANLADPFRMKIERIKPPAVEVKPEVQPEVPIVTAE